MRAKPSAALLLARILLGATLSFTASAAPPEISHIHPDYPGASPQIITGEQFDPGSTEVWVWDPPGSAELRRESAGEVDPPSLPERPPEGARRAEVLDVERQVMVASLEGTVAWVKTAEGFSKPALFNVAKPFWLSEERVNPGGLMFVYGFGLRPRWGGCEVLLRNSRVRLSARVVLEARTYRTTDSRLVYFEVPAEAQPGDYEVLVSNRRGGPWTWQKAGRIAVEQAKPAERVFDARQHGARGNGLDNDRPAIEAAIAAAEKAGGGVVFFPPGTYLTDQTILVPSGVSLRGANRETSILQGFGEPGPADRVVWFLQMSPPTSVVRLRSRTRIESLTIQGATWKGEGGWGMVEALPEEVRFPIGGEVRDVIIADCRLRALEESVLSRRHLYLSAFHFGPAARRVKLLNNDLFGSITLGVGGVGHGYRIDVICNTFHGGSVNDVVAFQGSLSESLIDANLFVDTPGRLVLGPGRRNHVRYNEIHQPSRSTWENAEEIYLFHGGVEAPQKTVGIASTAGPATLSDSRQDWRPGLYQDATVLILSGRGFGQYRRVVDSTANTLTVDPPWKVVPDQTSEYLVAPQFVENVLFANLNNSHCRLSLWLDCIANTVEMHRDDQAKGSDLWGEDASQVDDRSLGRGLSKFFPAYYNMFINCWMDGSALWLGTPGAKGNNAHQGIPSFGNFVLQNRIRQPHAYRTGFDINTPSTAGITVGGGSGRAGTSHTIVKENFLASTSTGISVDAEARKTFLLRNEFDHVEEPIVDQGARTVLRGNSVAGHKKEAPPSLRDQRVERDLPPWSPKPWQPEPAEWMPPLFVDVLALKQLVSQPVYCFYTGVNSEERQGECQERLKELFRLLKAYDAAHHGLPQAAFYPRDPLNGPDSLRHLLGPEARELLICPTCGPDLRRFGLNYAWNEKASGRGLADIKDPAGTWLLMDFVAPHDWMVRNRYCGHRGGVNVLYADGTVKWSEPFSSNPFDDKAARRWTDWAKEPGGPPDERK
jgi:prepilin-type processing-associated H-X9-DG protein